MNDRRIDGEPHVFGNAGTLFRGAMTWYDHATGSIWSQPWGRAIIGELKGMQLYLIPSEVTTWRAWRTEYPDTLALANDMDLLAAMPRQTFSDEFVIGLVLDQHAKAYHYQAAAAAGVINDNLGVYRIVLIVNGESIHAYLRQVGGQNLTFTLESEILKDEQTGTTWDVTRGRAIAGALRGEVLQPVPWVSAYDWAWLRFHPETAFYYP